MAAWFEVEHNALSQMNPTGDPMLLHSRDLSAALKGVCHDLRTGGEADSVLQTHKGKIHPTSMINPHFWIENLTSTKTKLTWLASTGSWAILRRNFRPKPPIWKQTQHCVMTSQIPLVKQIRVTSGKIRAVHDYRNAPKLGTLSSTYKISCCRPLLLVLRFTWHLSRRQDTALTLRSIALYEGTKHY